MQNFAAIHMLVLVKSQSNQRYAATGVQMVRRVLSLAVLGAALWFPSRALSAQMIGVGSPNRLLAVRVRDSALVSAINNGDLLKEAAPVRGTFLAIRVVAVPGVSGSAQDQESDRVVSWLLIAVSEFGELPTQRLYRLGPVFAPVVDSIVAVRGSPLVFISYGVQGRRQRGEVTASLDTIMIRDVRR